MVCWTRPMRKTEAAETGTEVSSALGKYKVFYAFCFPNPNPATVNMLLAFKD
jgi:hypothetical protein